MKKFGSCFDVSSRTTRTLESSITYSLQSSINISISRAALISKVSVMLRNLMLYGLPSMLYTYQLTWWMEFLVLYLLSFGLETQFLR